MMRKNVMDGMCIIAWKRDGKVVLLWMFDALLNAGLPPMFYLWTSLGGAKTVVAVSPL
jgi:hypothetical protein